MPRVRLKSGELRDEIRQPLYDTIDIAAAESPIATRTFYSAVQGKDLSLSNLRQNSQLEATVSFRVLGLGFDSQTSAAANRQALGLIQEHSSLELVIGEKQYWQGNATFMSGRTEVRDATTSATADQHYSRYGSDAVQSVMFGGKHVIDIPPLQTFRVNWVVSGMSATEITASTPAANTKLRFIQSLKGLLRRPVQ